MSGVPESGKWNVVRAWSVARTPGLVSRTGWDALGGDFSVFAPIYNYGLGTPGLPCTSGTHHYGEDASYRYPTPLFTGTRPRASFGPVGFQPPAVINGVKCVSALPLNSIEAYHVTLQRRTPNVSLIGKGKVRTAECSAVAGSSTKYADTSLTYRSLVHGTPEAITGATGFCD